MPITKPKAPLMPTKPRKYYEIAEQISFGWEQELNLNKFLKMVPPKIKRKDIKFKVVAVGEGDNCKMYLTASYVGKEINNNYQAELQAYKDRLSTYKEKMKVYHRNLSKYNRLVLQEEVKLRKSELQQMERQLKRMEKDA